TPARYSARKMRVRTDMRYAVCGTRCAVRGKNGPGSTANREPRTANRPRSQSFGGSERDGLEEYSGQGQRPLVDVEVRRVVRAVVPGRRRPDEEETARHTGKEHGHVFPAESACLGFHILHAEDLPGRLDDELCHRAIVHG